MMAEDFFRMVKLFQGVIFLLVNWDFFFEGKLKKCQQKYSKTHYIAPLKKEIIGSACPLNT